MTMISPEIRGCNPSLEAFVGLPNTYGDNTNKGGEDKRLFANKQVNVLLLISLLNAGSHAAHMDMQ